MSGKFYVTTPIYYVNDVPHIGHAYTNVAADAMARFHRLIGDRVFFLTGTDEHGQKIEKTAKQMGLEPKELADKVVVRFKDLWKVLNISNDDFIRTTEPRHEEVVVSFFKKLMDNGYVYKGIYEGWYCVSCETFFGESQLLEGRRCPQCGKETTRLREESYFFRLSAFEKRLLDYYEKNPDFIKPETRYNEIVSKVKQGLKDLSVSRTTITWGIPVPGDSKHVIYVWVDALVNYISAIGYSRDSKMFESWWPADLHLIGKDILWFHTVIWPAMLMAAGIEPPACVFAHGWWTVEGEKMSKSKGNVVDPFEVVKEYGVDAFRYFLLREVPFGLDGDFSKKAIVNRINSDLANDLGNLLHRGVSMVVNFFGGKLPAQTKPEDSVVNVCRKAIEEWKKGFENVAFHDAMASAWKIIDAVNLMVDRKAPWSLRHSNPAEAGNVLYHMLEACRILSYLVEPVMPQTAKKMRQILKVEEEGPFEELIKWGRLKHGTILEKHEPLFPRIEKKEVVEVKTEEKKISFEEFQKLDLRIAKVLEAERVPGTDKLLKLKIDVGGGETRTIVAGIAQFYSPEELVGKCIVVVANLKPAKIRGIVSEGMLLAASGERIVLITPEKDVAPGAKVR